MINAQKSSITFSSKTTPEVRARVKLYLGIEREGGVGKYLGLPEHFGRRKKDFFSSIVDRMKQKSLSWTTQFLSTAGKATMLQSVLSPIPNFAMTCFQLLVSLCKRIQSVLTRFWWDSKEGERKICWISWDKLTQPKSVGGLGFRDIQTFNHALLAKISWRIITKPDCLLARVLLGKYCHKVSFLKTNPSSSISHGWRGILLGRDLLIKHLGKAVGNGDSINVWSDNWIEPVSNIKPIGPVLAQDVDLIVSDLRSRETREWNKAKIDCLLPELSSQILSIRPSILGIQDTYVWPLQKSGQYTAKSGYFSMHTQGDTSMSSPVLGPDTWNWKKNIWSPPLLPKLKFFLWKVALNALPTGDNLQKKGLLINTNCARCGGTESIYHILVHCTFAKEVWEVGPWLHQLNPLHFVNFKELLQASHTWVNLPPYGISGNFLPWLCWTLWTSRNQLLFENRTCTPQDVVTKAISLCREWENAQTPERSAPHTHSSPLQSPVIDSLTVICNTDAAWRSDQKAAGLGWIFSDQDSVELNRASRLQHHVSSACMAEALAIREALLHASSLNINQICLRTDSQVLVRAISSRSRTMDLHGVLSDIDSLAFSPSSSFSKYSFQFIPRAQNGPADSLAKSCLFSLGLKP